MAERVQFPKTKDSLQNKAISLLVKLFERKKHTSDEFSGQKHPDSKAGEEVWPVKTHDEVESFPVVENTLLEQDLPIITETREALDRAKEQGRIPTKEVNPFGKLDSCNIAFYGDIHLPGSNPEQAMVEINPVYKYLQRIGVRHIFNGLFKGRNWALEGKHTEVMDAFGALTRVIDRFGHRAVQQNQQEGASSTNTILFNIGDNGNTEHAMGDAAYVLLQQEEYRATLESQLNSRERDSEKHKVFVVNSMGNHDTDTQNHGLEQDWFYRSILGSQIFTQEIGSDTLLVSLDTNFYSAFWQKAYEERTSELNRMTIELGHLITREGRSDKVNELERWCNLQRKGLGLIAEDYKRQERVIKTAKLSNRRIILVGHEEAYLNQALGDLSDTNVTETVSGHTHQHQDILTNKRNARGELIRHLNVGASPAKILPVGKRHTLSGFGVHVGERYGMQRVEKLVPEKSDYVDANVL